VWVSPDCALAFGLIWSPGLLLDAVEIVIQCPLVARGLDADLHAAALRDAIEDVLQVASSALVSDLL